MKSCHGQVPFFPIVAPSSGAVFVSATTMVPGRFLRAVVFLSTLVDRELDDWEHAREIPGLGLCEFISRRWYETMVCVSRSWCSETSVTRGLQGLGTKGHRGVIDKVR